MLRFKIYLESRIDKMFTSVVAREKDKTKTFKREELERQLSFMKIGTIA